MAKRIYISVSNDIVTDNRVLKISEALTKWGQNITIVGRELPASLQAENIPFRTKRFRMLFRKGVLFYKWLNIRLFFYLLFKPVDILVANDLDTLLPNFLVSKLRCKSLVYDAHEYFTGVPELMNRPFVRGVWKRIEMSTLPYVENMMTVNRSIASLYQEEYGIEPVVVRNFSKRSGFIPSARIDFGLDKEELLLVVQGTGINVGRGGSELLEALARCERVHLIFIGKGNVVPELKARVAESGLAERVTFLPVMPWEEMMKITGMADVGMSLDSGNSPNYYYSLPNKIFDYLNAGVAIIATDLPEISAIVSENKCGLLVSGNDPGLIAEAIRKIETDRDLLKELKENSVKASAKYSWEAEIEQLKIVYRKAGVDIS
ncbi:MAG TPA: glycosyltransferase family 4 protein [Bacteroidales bacterium]|nr:glycosyltransferase family 4 protein [Bacteroidales bacterium]